MPFLKLPSLLRRLLRLPKRSKHPGTPFNRRTTDPSLSSSLPPPASLPSDHPSPPSLTLISLNRTSSPSTPYRVPVEVIERILFFVFPPSKDPSTSTTFPSPPSHPVQLLLACKGLYHLVLPHFYHSIVILRSKDWITLFNEEDGILGGRELGMGRPSLYDRQSWVKELFVQGRDGGLVWIPWDLERAKNNHLGGDALRNRDPSFLQLSNLQFPLPRLHSVFILRQGLCIEDDQAPYEYEGEELNLREYISHHIPWWRSRSYRNDLIFNFFDLGSPLQRDAVARLGLQSCQTYIHHPLGLWPPCSSASDNWKPVFPLKTWVVDLHEADPHLDGSFTNSYWWIPWRANSIVWIGTRDIRSRNLLRGWAVSLGSNAKGWRLVLKDGTTRAFLDEELEADRDL